MSGTIVRLARAEDGAVVQALLSAFAEESRVAHRVALSLAQQVYCGTRALQPTFIAWQNDEPVGFMTLCPAITGTEIKHLWVSPEYRRQGYAGLLLKQVSERSWFALTSPDNEAAAGLYIKAGAQDGGLYRLEVISEGAQGASATAPLPYYRSFEPEDSSFQLNFSLPVPGAAALSMPTKEQAALQAAIATEKADYGTCLHPHGANGLTCRGESIVRLFSYPARSRFRAEQPEHNHTEAPLYPRGKYRNHTLTGEEHTRRGESSGFQSRQPDADFKAAGRAFAQLNTAAVRFHEVRHD